MGYVLFVLFVGLPLAEIAAFIQIGSIIGLGWTLAGIVFTAITGAMLVRQQGFKVLNEARGNLERNELPITQVVHGAFILVAGLLLLTPGFVTDTIGFLLLVPFVRTLLSARAGVWLKNNATVVAGHGGRQGRQGPRGPGGDVIDGEAVDISEPPEAIGPPDANSPWAGKKGDQTGGRKSGA